jgi:hypothetical protein
MGGGALGVACRYSSAYAMRAYTWPSRFGCPSVVNWCGLPSLAGLRTGLYKRGGPWEQETLRLYTHLRRNVDDLAGRMLY